MASSILSLASSRPLSVLRPDKTADAFASDLGKRIRSSAGLDETALDDANGIQTDKSAQLQELQDALAQTVSWMTKQHGQSAASAMMGIVYKRLGDGEISEKNLGDAFLDVTRFIDAQFGTQAGDEFLDHLNGALNDSLNAFFDNGITEQFLAVNASASFNGTSISAASSSELLSQVKDAVQELVSSLKDLRPQQKTVDNPYNAYLAASTPMKGVLLDSMV